LKEKIELVAKKMAWQPDRIMSKPVY
jgi:hypothetical protein